VKSEAGEAGQEVGIGERSPDGNFLALACIVACKADFGQEIRELSTPNNLRYNNTIFKTSTTVENRI